LRKVWPVGVRWLVVVAGHPPPRFLFSQPGDNCFQGCSTSSTDTDNLFVFVYIHIHICICVCVCICILTCHCICKPGDNCFHGCSTSSPATFFNSPSSLRPLTAQHRNCDFTEEVPAHSGCQHAEPRPSFSFASHKSLAVLDFGLFNLAG